VPDSQRDRTVVLRPSRRSSDHNILERPDRSGRADLGRVGAFAGESDLSGMSDGDDVDQAVQGSEVARVPRVERQFGGASNGCNHEIDCACASRFATCCCHCCVDPPIRACCVSIERQRRKRCFGSLQSVLTTSALRWINGRMRTGREFGHRERSDSDLGWKHAHVDGVEIDHNGRVEHALRNALVRHGVRCLGRRLRRGPAGTVQHRWVVLLGRSVRWSRLSRSADVGAE